MISVIVHSGQEGEEGDIAGEYGVLSIEYRGKRQNSKGAA
jgi:hypothetical protein